MLTMNFAGVLFWLFFAFFYGVFLLVRKNIPLRNVYLLAVSYWCIWLWDGRLVAVLLVVTASSFAIGQLLPRIQRTASRRTAFIAVICLYVGLLGYCKYTGFFADTLSSLLRPYGFAIDTPTVGILLPLGLSFYLFQVISYLADIYTGKQEPSTNWIQYALFLAFFPKFIAGPIERASHLLPQFDAQQPVTRSMLSEGLYLIVWGLILKFCIADNAAPIAALQFAQYDNLQFYAIGSPLALTLQIYADFSGYTNIARGMAQLMGFSLTANFDMPYISRSPREFWRRWHRSLSQWVRDYIYIPLGGNRHGTLKMYRNLFITMLLAGLWHGASWPFVFWGMYQGLLLIYYDMFGKMLEPYPAFSRVLAHPLISIPFYFLLTVVGWILFSSQSVAQFLVILTSIGKLILHGQVLTNDYALPLAIVLWLPIILMESLQLLSKQQYVVPRLSIFSQVLFYYAACYALIFFTPFTVQEFIYGQF